LIDVILLFAATIIIADSVKGVKPY